MLPPGPDWASVLTSSSGGPFSHLILPGRSPRAELRLGGGGRRQQHRVLVKTSRCRPSSSTPFFDTGLCLRIAALLRLAPQKPPLDDTESAPFLQDIFEAFQVSSVGRYDLLFIASGQPLTLVVLADEIQYSEASPCAQLGPGVSFGVGSSLEPSLPWPKRDSELFIPVLHLCEDAWRSAVTEPTFCVPCSE